MSNPKDKIAVHPSYIRGAMAAMDRYRTDLPEAVIRLEKNRETLESLRTPTCLTLRDVYTGTVVITPHVKNCRLCRAYIDSYQALEKEQASLGSKIRRTIHNIKSWLLQPLSPRT